APFRDVGALSGLREELKGVQNNAAGGIVGSPQASASSGSAAVSAAGERLPSNIRRRDAGAPRRQEWAPHTDRRCRSCWVRSMPASIHS
ncbi:MAG TPA: hypothetical protein VK956_02720, partial [Verrucomicrobium sp.]|nr:hypothetical protein [Verrucomicrobium sp.]